MGMQSLMRDLGYEEKITLKTDSKATAWRRGVGKVRNLETMFLWIQEAIACWKIAIEKVLGTLSPSNALTKFVPAEEVQKIASKVCLKLMRSG